MFKFFERMILMFCLGFVMFLCFVFAIEMPKPWTRYANQPKDNNY